MSKSDFEYIKESLLKLRKESLFSEVRFIGVCISLTCVLIAVIFLAVGIEIAYLVYALVLIVGVTLLSISIGTIIELMGDYYNRVKDPKYHEIFEQNKVAHQVIAFRNSTSNISGVYHTKVDGELENLIVEYKNENGLEKITGNIAVIHKVGVDTPYIEFTKINSDFKLLPNGHYNAKLVMPI